MSAKDGDDGAELMLALQKGDKSAFTPLYERYDAAVRAYVTERIGERDEALSDEVLTNFWGDLFIEAGGFDPAKGAVEAFLVGRAGLYCKRARQKPKSKARNPQGMSDEVAAALVSREERPDACAERAEDRVRGASAPADLSAEEREIARRLGEGQSMQEIARDLKKEKSTMQGMIGRLGSKIGSYLGRRSG
jgi:DNA-directed RNA polymerase specialized sigma24 family protein